MLTPALARQGIELSLPSIEAVFATVPTMRQRQLHIVVLDPAIRFGEADLEQAIVAEHSLSEEHWDLDLRTLARKKAAVVWEHGLDSHVVQQQRPYLYHKGDNKYAGAVCHHGLTVSTAGIEWYYDELFAAWVACACRGLALAEMEKIIGEEGRHFV